MQFLSKVQYKVSGYNAGMSKKFTLLLIAVAITTAAIYLYFTYGRGSARIAQTFAFFRDPASRPDLMMNAGTRCGTLRSFSRPMDWSALSGKIRFASDINIRALIFLQAQMQVLHL
jgi:hypothetical protein